MIRYLQLLRKTIIVILLVIITAILLYATAHIVYKVAYEFIATPFAEFSSDMLVELFGIFLIILIGIELLETVKVFLKDDEIHVELVVLVAIIAIARKVIVWNFKEHTPMELIALSGMLLALGISYYLIKRSTTKHKAQSDSSPKGSQQLPEL
jgi:uncharacterized membrane protein (DUF373 family)